ncbi:MAG: DHH family phosphoesterase, partial [Nanoarchaeota archaeon]|nr:DHH family phosphoesterase [Nanoarchaeota archaeon]
GMVGDLYERNIGKIFGEILRDAETIVKKGVLVYPSTRPLDKALEYSSNPYIPGISGSRAGVIELLRDADLASDKGRYKALYELSEEEMKKLITAIALRSRGGNQENLVGNLFLVKFFNKLEDARELSALINACSRMDYSEVALGFCLGNKIFRKEAEKIYINYRQSLVSALKYISETNKLEGKNYMIINARDKIKDTIIGTVASMISHSPLYEEGLVIVALAYNKDKIKVSARLAGRKGRNLRELLHRVVVPIGGEVGGHPNAAGCLISKEKEEEFIGELRKVLDLEVVKV